MKKSKLIISFIFTVGLILRLYNIDFGLPNQYLEDEAFFIKPALHIANGHWNPEWFGAPAHSLIYLLGIFYKILHEILNYIHNSNINIYQNYQYNISIFHIIGRLICALFGSFSIIIIYLIGKKFNLIVGYTAASIYALSFYFIEHAQIIRPDIIQTFFILTCIYYLFNIEQKPKQSNNYIFLGISLILAVISKYPSLFIIPSFIVLLIILYRNKQVYLHNIILLIISSIASILLFSPFLLFDFNHVINDVLLENQANHFGHNSIGFFDNILWYISNVCTWQIGTISAIIVVLGIIIHLFKKKNERMINNNQLLIIIVSALSYFIGISMLNLHWERWFIPISSIMIVLLGISIYYLYIIFNKKKLIFAILLVFIFFAPLLRLSRFLYMINHKSTYDIAADWINKNIPKKSGIVVEPYTPTINNKDYYIKKIPNMSMTNYKELKSNNFNYFIVSEYIYGRIKENNINSSAINNYNILFSKSTMIYSIKDNANFSKDILLYSSDFSVLKTLDLQVLFGPQIDIYEINIVK